MTSGILGNIPKHFKIKVLIGIFAFGLVFGFRYSAFGEISNSQLYSCKSHDDCAIKGCCPAVCRNKIYESKPCPNPDMECEVSYWPPDQICGCINNICQGSNELFVKYGRIKDQAMNIAVSDSKGAMGYCDQLHGEYIFECYTKVATNLLSVNISEAIKVCDRITGKYYSGIPVEYECYSRIAQEVVEKNPDLAIDLCTKASIMVPSPDSINYRERCARGIAAVIAKTDLRKAFKACDIKNIRNTDSNCCKFQAIEAAEQKYINDDPQKAIEILVESNICEVANFSGYMSDYYKTSCKNLCSIVNARGKK